MDLGPTGLERDDDRPTTAPGLAKHQQHAQSGPGLRPVQSVSTIRPGGEGSSEASQSQGNESWKWSLPQSLKDSPLVAEGGLASSSTLRPKKAVAVKLKKIKGARSPPANGGATSEI